MPKKTTATATKAKPTAADAKAAKAKIDENKAKIEAKRVAREEQEAKQQATIVKRVVNGDEKVAAVASELKITPGKAAFLIMKHRVAEGEVAKISGKDDETLLKAINAARLKADEHSSWGWLAARSGRSEGWIKGGLATAGLYEPRAENIASKRSAAKPKVEKAKAAPKGKATSGKKVRGNA